MLDSKEQPSIAEGECRLGLMKKIGLNASLIPRQSRVCASNFSPAFLLRSRNKSKQPLRYSEFTNYYSPYNLTSQILRLRIAIIKFPANASFNRDFEIKMITCFSIPIRSIEPYLWIMIIWFVLSRLRFEAL